MIGQAAVSELVQLAMPNRGGDWWDLLADLLGIGLGWALASRPPKEAETPHLSASG
jgi:uncharacterized membrane protein HdeD (DUF308 family)